MLDQQIFWASFAVCFLCFLARTAYNYLNFRGYKVTKGRRTTAIMYVIMAVLWFAWFQMNFTDPVKYALPLWLRVLGLVFFIIGVSLFLFAHAGLGRLKDNGRLVEKGVYSKIRNPMYLGFILWVAGFPIFMQGMLTLASAVIWIVHFLIWRNLEERDLEQRFKGYREYKARTWF